MYRLAVRAERRRDGIARALVDAGEARLREQGAPKVTALVGRGDTQAEGLWRAAGYKDDVAIGRWVRSLRDTRPRYIGCGRRNWRLGG